eukprot:3242908-Amphidinium_carterae.1
MWKIMRPDRRPVERSSKAALEDYAKASKQSFAAFTEDWGFCPQRSIRAICAPLAWRSPKYRETPPTPREPRPNAIQI